LTRVLPRVDGSPTGSPRTDNDALYREDRATARAIDDLLHEEPGAEPSLVRAISQCASGTVFLGNSLPIREWDAFATRDAGGAARLVFASRGANGIDGQLSTAFGAASALTTGAGTPRECWAVVGDLTALYDLAAPWVLPQLDVERLRIVVINNGGGRIFDRISGDATLRNAHSHDFRAWAEMWGLGYARSETVDRNATLAERSVIELVPDDAATERFWRRYDGIART
jgi:2-succinyl-5-enolpyruvyl-6-hydroxy-3-cyclohexene-1-carboxylate synthase